MGAVRMGYPKVTHDNFVLVIVITINQAVLGVPTGIRTPVTAVKGHPMKASED